MFNFSLTAGYVLHSLRKNRLQITAFISYILIGIEKFILKVKICSSEINIVTRTFMNMLIRIPLPLI